jgi:PAS domain S-box-containing protein
VTGAPGILLYASQPLRSLEGAPLGTLCVIDDKPRAGLTDEQLGGLRTLADSAMELLERWRLDSRIKSEAARSKTAIHDLEQRFQTLADAMPQLVWSSLPDGHSDYFNRFWCEYTGAPASASHGDAWMDFLHPDDKETAQRVWREALELEGAYDLEYRLRRADGVYRWMLVRGLPMRDESGAVSRWLGTCTDIHERKAAADQHELLTRELSHRIKNIFAVISGLITLSLRRRPAIAEIGRELQQRVLALGRAHDFVRPHGAPARPYLSHGGLRGMLEILFAPYQDPHGTRLRLTGGDVRIDDRSATPLALFFHELATNSAKYGALSVDDGYVEIAIDEGDTTRLAWTEHGGPPPPAAHEPGFGASLIDMSVTRQLGGTLDYEWRPDGLRVAAAIPAAALAR